MTIPQTTHKRIKYRNGEFGHLITTERKESIFTTMTVRDKFDSIIYHRVEGNYLPNGEEHDLDIAEVMNES